jgi:hypothetical protein
MTYQQPFPPDPNHPTQPQYPAPPQYTYPQQPYPPPPPYGQPSSAESPYPPSQPYPTYPPQPPQPPQKRDTNLPLIITIATATLLIIAVVVVLALRPSGLLSGNNPGSQTSTHTTRNTPQTGPTATPTFNPIFYQADWSNGFDGWTGSNQWSVSNGVLYSDGSATANILAPYTSPGNSNYEVDASIRILGANDSFFGLVARGQGTYSNLRGYIGGMAGVTDNGGGDFSGLAAISYVGDTGSALSKSPFGAGSGWHMYHLVVNANYIDLFIDGTHYVHLDDSTFRPGGEVGLRAASGTRIAVQSFAVTVVTQVTQGPG